MSAPTEKKLDVQAEVIANEQVAPGCYAMDVRCPDLAARLGPGQFVQVKVTTGDDPFLRRPFSICDLIVEDGVPVGFRMLYIVVGRGTSLMAGWRDGVRASILGPLGNTFFLDRIPKRAVFVAGGIGVAPFPLLARALHERGCEHLEMLFGARDASGIYYVDELESLGVEVLPATEDGSLGHRGRVTDLMASRIPGYDEAETVFYACGPNPMFRAMGAVLATTSIPCQMALEQEMACGFGVCNGCVVRVHGPAGPAWEKVCADGAVFDAAHLILEEL